MICAYSLCGREFEPGQGKFGNRYCSAGCCQKGIVESGRRRGGIPQKWFHTERTDDEIRRGYDGTSASIDRLSARTGFPRSTVKDRARKLGLCRFREPRWTPEDEAWLRDNLAGHSWAFLSRTLHRTIASVQVKAKRLGASRRDLETYSATAAAEIMGVDRHRVLSWIECGQLAATRDRNEPRVPYVIEPGAIRRFVLQYPGEIDLRRIEGTGLKATFLDIVAGGDLPTRTLGAGARGDTCGQRGTDEEGAW
jgi:hypothetical protein